MGSYLDPSVLTACVCVCADVLSLLISNLVLTAATNKFDLINFDPASVCHSGRVCANNFSFFILVLQ